MLKLEKEADVVSIEADGRTGEILEDLTTLIISVLASITDNYYLALWYLEMITDDAQDLLPKHFDKLKSITNRR